MPGPLESIGSIASEFSRGFLQGRSLRQQQHTQDLQQKQQNIENLSRLSEIHRNNPSMRETIDSQIESAIHDLDAASSGQAKKSPKPGGAGSMFSTLKNFFSGRSGQQQARPDALQAPLVGPVAPAAQPTAMGPKPVSPDSQTYGDLGEYFGPATGVPAQATTAPVANELPKPPDTTAPAAPAGSPRLQLPAPTAIRQHALTAESTPKYGYYDQAKVASRAQQEATDSLDEALGMAEATLDKHPQIRTFADATADPNIGQTFRQLMDYAARLEGSGLIEKGYVDQWKQNRFPDTRQGYVAPRRPDQMTSEERAGTEYQKPADQRDMNVINGYLDEIRQKATAGQSLSPREQAYKSSYDTLIKNGRTPMQAYSEMARADNAPAAPKRELMTTRNPRSGNNEYAWITEGGVAPEFTGLLAPTQFNLSGLRVSKPAYTNYPGPNGTTIPIQNGTTTDYSPAEVIGAVKRGDITGEALKLIIDETQDPKAKATLQEFLTNPGKY